MAGIQAIIVGRLRYNGTMKTAHIDHIIYATPHSLEDAIATIEALLGVKAIIGGQHVGIGTHNALLSLGGRSYLEIIAPDPAQPEPPRPRSFGIDSLTKPALVTWASATDDIDAQVAASRAAGYDPGKLIDGGRKKPDGTQLKWRSTKRPEALAGQPLPAAGLVPFLISWGDTPHPAENTPTGCQIVALRGEHPDPDSVTAMLTALDTPLPIARAEKPQLIASIETAQGLVTLQ